MRQIFLFFLIFLAYNCIAQISINEFSASNIRDYQDNYDKGEDWIELYNSSDIEVDLSGWYLSDKDSKPKKWKIPAGTKIDAKGFLTFIASGRDEVSGEFIHTNFRFTQTKEDEFILLADIGGKIVESFKLPITQVSHSMGKPVDGGNTWVIFEKPTYNTSNQNEKYFKTYAATPTIDKVAGAYANAINVSVGNNVGFTTRYTLDGSLPNSESPEYTGSLAIDLTSVLKVRNFSNDITILPSKIAFATYFINEPISTLPIISVAADEAKLLANGDRELKPYGSFEYFSKDGKLISTSYGEMDSHGQDSWVNPQRSLDWISRDEMGYNSGIPTKLFSYSKREDFQRIILRASGDDNYPAIDDIDHRGSTHVRDEYVHTLVQQGGMKMDVRASERVIVYINGEYWGVYAIREKPDDTDYTEYTYKQDKYNVQFLKTWGNSWAEYGGQQSFTDWGKLRDFILENDMGNEDNYNKVLEQYNVISLMDYMIANLSVVSSDWLNYNTGWWRGLDEKGDHKKWGYIMWDNDATFDYYINYSGVPTISPNAKACDIEDISTFMDDFFPQDSQFVKFEADSFFIDGMWEYFPADSFWVVPDPGKHEKIFLKLLEENNNFKNQYYARYADMNSTAFSCENMISTLDSLLAIIEPEMPRQIKRWGGTLTEWKNNVKKLKAFVSLRCNRINKGLVDCYDELKGPYNVTLVTDPPNQGTIKFNTLTHTTLPWKGAYFGGMPNTIEISENANVKFRKWVSKNGTTIFDDVNLKNTVANITANDTLIAVFENSTATKEESNIAFSINPNPVKNLLNIEMDQPINGLKYSLLNTVGSTVQSGILSTKTIDVSGIQTGVFLLKISDQSKLLFTSKVFVVR
jgi:hypothetical protein